MAYLGKGSYDIHDYKTSATLPPDEKFDTDRQLALYQIAIRQKYRDAKDVRPVWHYVLFNREIASYRTDRQLTDLKKQVISLIKTIEKDTKVAPIESKLCGWCEYPDYCPAKKHETKVSTKRKRSREGPQSITVHGQPSVVVLSSGEYERLKRPKGNFVEFMRRSPLFGVDLKLGREQTRTREADIA